MSEVLPPYRAHVPDSASPQTSQPSELPIAKPPKIPGSPREEVSQTKEQLIEKAKILNTAKEKIGRGVKFLSYFGFFKDTVSAEKTAKLQFQITLAHFLTLLDVGSGWINDIVFNEEQLHQTAQAFVECDKLSKSLSRLQKTGFPDIDEHLNAAQAFLKKANALLRKEPPEINEARDAAKSAKSSITKFILSRDAEKRERLQENIASWQGVYKNLGDRVSEQLSEVEKQYHSLQKPGETGKKKKYTAEEIALQKKYKKGKELKAEIEKAKDELEKNVFMEFQLKLLKQNYQNLSARYEELIGFDLHAGKERVVPNDFATLHNLADKAANAIERALERQKKGMKSHSGITQKDIDKTTKRLAKMRELQRKINQSKGEFDSQISEGISQRALIAFHEKYSQLHQEFLDIKNPR